MYSSNGALIGTLNKVGLSDSSESVSGSLFFLPQYQLPLSAKSLSCCGCVDSCCPTSHLLQSAVFHAYEQVFATPHLMFLTPQEPKEKRFGIKSKMSRLWGTAVDLPSQAKKEPHAGTGSETHDLAADWVGGKKPRSAFEVNSNLYRTIRMELETEAGGIASGKVPGLPISVLCLQTTTSLSDISCAPWH